MSTQGFEQAFEKVGQLARAFQANADFYLSKSYQEAQVRKDFIDKFFIALGWDVNHEFQSNPFEQEVKVEPPVATGGTQRRADYAFHVAPNFRDMRFLVEAKKPSRDLATPDNYFQTIRYGWNKQNPLAGLTDFEHLHILDCRYKPDIETAIHRCVKKYHFTDYLDREKFAEIYWLISREAVADGSLEKFAGELQRPRGGAKQRNLFSGAYLSIDESFLKELDDYRDRLARAFKSQNPDLDSETLTEATQRTLDRLVFMRFLEDKLIEPAHFVATFGERGTAWEDFVAASRRLDVIYNGIVFKNHDLLDAPDFRVDDHAFANLCEVLSHKNSPYDFNAIPIHILGSIYERFLGNVIVATDKRVRVEPKPEVRKAGGVYYTPDYIVRFIADNTVGQLIEGKTPDEIGELRFADIACGSGSFLLGIYDVLLEYHVKYYNEHPRKARKGDCVTKDGVLHLSLEKKRDILLNNIYGVDIDPQAVEVTQLSLYLKLLDEETIASARGYQLRMHAAILPSLNKNIVCGNSLIGLDILNGQLFTDEDERKLNPLNFENAFPNVMKAGGFDAVVGNPPYVRQESLREIKAYLKRRYQSFESTADLYVYFLERALALLRAEGRLSFVVSSSFLRTNFGRPLRTHIRDSAALLQLVDFGGLPVFEAAKDTYVCIPLVSKQPQPARVRVAKVESLEGLDLSKLVSSTSYAVPIARFSAEAWRIDEERVSRVFDKLKRRTKPLGEIVQNRIFRGVLTGLNEAFEIDATTRRRFVRECRACEPLIRPFLGGQDIRRYLVRETGRYLIAIPCGWTQREMSHPRKKTTKPSEREAWNWFANYFEPLAEHLLPFAEPAKKRQDQGDYWWELRPCDYYEVLNQPKIIYPDIAKHPRFFLDTQGTYIRNTAYCLGAADSYLVGLLNSRLAWFAMSQISIPFGTRAGEYRYRLFTQYVEQIPIRAIDVSDSEDKSRRDQIVRLVEQMLDAQQRLEAARSDKDKNYYSAKSAAFDRQIDALVYELYGLTEEEIQIVESSTREFSDSEL